jgi:hypothetical protein
MISYIIKTVAEYSNCIIYKIFKNHLTIALYIYILKLITDGSHY